MSLHHTSDTPEISSSLDVRTFFWEQERNTYAQFFDTLENDSHTYKDTPFYQAYINDIQTVSKISEISARMAALQNLESKYKEEKIRSDVAQHPEIPTVCYDILKQILTIAITNVDKNKKLEEKLAILMKHLWDAQEKGAVDGVTEKDAVEQIDSPEQITVPEQTDSPEQITVPDRIKYFSSIRNLFTDISIAHKPDNSPEQANLKRIYPDFSKIYKTEIKNLFTRIQKLYAEYTNMSVADIEKEYADIQDSFSELQQSVQYAYHTGAIYSHKQAQVMKNPPPIKEISEYSYIPETPYGKTCELLIDLEDMKKKMSIWSVHTTVVRQHSDTLKALSQRAVHMLQSREYSEYEDIKKHSDELRESFDYFLWKQTVEQTSFMQNSPHIQETESEKKEMEQKETGLSEWNIFRWRALQTKELTSEIQYLQKKIGRWLYIYRKKHINRLEYQNLDAIIKLSLPGSVIHLQKRRKDIWSAFQEIKESEFTKGDVSFLLQEKLEKRRNETERRLEYLESHFMSKALPRLGRKRVSVWLRGLWIKMGWRGRSQKQAI